MSQSSKSPPRRQRFIDTAACFVLVVVIGNAIAWSIPGNVAKHVARERHVVLGRFSRAHFCWLVFATVLSAIAVFIRTGATPQARKRRAFGVIAVILGLFPAAFLLDLGLRMRTEYPYDPGDAVYHRPPNAKYEVAFEDVPEARRSWLDTPHGYGAVDCTLTYDVEGFRNVAALDRCDVVTLGDSFTEGSRVSDDQPWPVRFGAVSGMTVCNLGMSGYSPPEYLAALEHHGLPKKPRLVICLLYEGNDFRSGHVKPRSGISFQQVIATSPLIVAANDFLIGPLAEIGAERRLSCLEPLSWLPLSVPQGDGARYYAFAAKQLTALYSPREKLEIKGGWYVTGEKIKKMKALCKAAGAKFVVAYAPVKAHVVFPLVAQSLPADDVRTFARYKKKDGLPDDPDEFMATLLARLPNQEAIVREFCERREIPFVALTDALRADAAAGRQSYYTYDQHWTPQGHETAAKTIYAALKSHPAVAAMFTQPPPAQVKDARLAGTPSGS